MRVIVQRVKRAHVSINEEIVAQIKYGMVIFLGIEDKDNKGDIEWLSNKIGYLRIFGDAQKKMNLSISDVHGEIIVISQFTLHASTKKGNRPSFIKAANPEVAFPIYEDFIYTLSSITGIEVKSGEFGADMQVELVNDGPVTFYIDSKNKE